MGKGPEMGKVSMAFTPQVGCFHGEKRIAAPSLCEHKRLSQGKGESPAVPHVLRQWGPKNWVIFHPLLLCLVQSYLLGYGHAGSTDAEIQ